MDDQKAVPSRENPRSVPPPPPPRPPPPSILDRFRSRLKDREREGGVGPPTTEEIVRFYQELLVELTTNSKPVITELSIIAGDQKEHGLGIADAICDRILKVSIDQKLPSLYLLDSIVKNIGREYMRYFALRLPEVFCETYKKVNSSLHPAMRRLFKTWPPYFPSSVLRKIEGELQFSPHGNQKLVASADVRRPESQSPRSSHGIHVNTKYLEAHHQSEHSAVDAQHARVSSSLQPHRKKSSSQYGEYDIDHTEVLPPRPGTERVGTAVVGAVEGPQPSRVSSPPRIGFRRSISPSSNRCQIDVFPERFVGRASLSHTGHVWGSGRVSDQNGSLARSWLSSDSAQNAEGSSLYNRNIGCDKLRARLLIDAYGGKSSSQEKLPKVQRLNVNGVESDTVMKNFQNTEEEEYVWENMSPTLAGQSRGGDQRPFGPNTGLGEPNASLQGNEFRKSDWPAQAFMPRTDEPANLIQDSRHGSHNNEYQNDIGTREEPWLQNQISHHAYEPLKISNVFSQFPQQNLSPRTQGRVLPYLASRTAPTDGQKLVSPIDNTQQAEVLRWRVPNNHPDTLNFDASAIEKHLAQQPHSPHASSVIWPPVHKSQPLPFLPIPPHQQFRSPFDLDPNKYIVNPCPNPNPNPNPNRPLFLPRQYVDTAAGGTSNSLPYVQSNSHFNLEQNSNLRAWSHDVPGSFVPHVPEKMQSHSAPQTLNNLQAQGAAAGPVPGSFVPPMPAQKTSHSAPQTLNNEQVQGAATGPVPGSFVPPVPAQMPSHSLPQTLNNVQVPGAAADPVLTSLLPGVTFPHPRLVHPVLPPRPPPPHLSPFSYLPPPPTQNISSASMQIPAGPLPPLPPGPPPSSLQTRAASQNAGAFISESPATAYSGLISSLMAQGLISLTPSNPPQDTVGLEFNAELLKVRHESSINALYGDLPRQCTTCGLRFRTQEDHRSHMDWHVTKNRIAKNIKHKPSRNWYVSAKEWLTGTETLGTDGVPGFLPLETVTQENEEREVAVPADEDQHVCALCGEPFEDFYSDETEEWMYKGAVYLNAPDGSIEGIERSQLGPIVHAKCRPEPTNGAGKT